MTTHLSIIHEAKEVEYRVCASFIADDEFVLGAHVLVQCEVLRLPS